MPARLAGLELRFMVTKLEGVLLRGTQLNSSFGGAAAALRQCVLAGGRGVVTLMKTAGARGLAHNCSRLACTQTNLLAHCRKG